MQGRKLSSRTEVSKYLLVKSQTVNTGGIEGPGPPCPNRYLLQPPQTWGLVPIQFKFLSLWATLCLIGLPASGPWLLGARDEHMSGEALGTAYVKGAGMCGRHISLSFPASWQKAQGSEMEKESLRVDKHDQK